jgi:endoglucanase
VPVRTAAASTILVFVESMACLVGCGGSSTDSGGSTPAQDASVESGSDAGAEDSSSSTADAPSDAVTTDVAGDASPPVALPALPLRTSSRWIVDANGKRFKLASVSWYGADSKDFVVAGLDIAGVGAIASRIRALGFNSVRLPWSSQMFESNPLVDPARLTKNPSLVGLHALDVLDAVVAALAHEGLVVILDNHRSHADWCCDLTHGDGLWYAPGYPESSFIADWKAIVQRYASQPAVVGVDLRNELRTTFAPGAPSTCTACGTGCPCLTPVWTGDNGPTDWYGAAQRAGNAVLSVAPDMLVVVEGLGYSLDLTGVYGRPLTLSVANRLVYSPHDYAFSHAAYAGYAAMKTDLGKQWGFILTQGQPYTAPLWVGEFGTSHASASDVSGATGQGFWFQSFRQYLSEADIDWSYWAINGTEATGYSRTLGSEEGYGVLDTAWSASALPALTTALQQLQPKTQGP